MTQFVNVAEKRVNSPGAIFPNGLQNSCPTVSPNSEEPDKIMVLQLCTCQIQKITDPTADIPEGIPEGSGIRKVQEKEEDEETDWETDDEESTNGLYRERVSVEELMRTLERPLRKSKETVSRGRLSILFSENSSSDETEGKPQQVALVGKQGRTTCFSEHTG